MQHLLILGHTPAIISPNYNHAVWRELFTSIQSYLRQHPKSTPITGLGLGFESIAAEAAIRLNRPFICHSIPTNQHPPSDWCSADKMVWINAMAEASQILHTPWPLQQTNAVLAYWNGKENRVGEQIKLLSQLRIPVTNCFGAIQCP